MTLCMNELNLVQFVRSWEWLPESDFDNIYVERIPFEDSRFTLLDKNTTFVPKSCVILDRMSYEQARGVWWHQLDTVHCISIGVWVAWFCKYTVDTFLPAKSTECYDVIDFVKLLHAPARYIRLSDKIYAHEIVTRQEPRQYFHQMPIWDDGLIICTPNRFDECVKLSQLHEEYSYGMLTCFDLLDESLLHEAYRTSKKLIMFIDGNNKKLFDQWSLQCEKYDISLSVHIPQPNNSITEYDHVWSAKIWSELLENNKTMV